MTTLHPRAAHTVDSADTAAPHPRPTARAFRHVRIRRARVRAHTREGRRPDGWLVVTLATIAGAALACAFQATNLLWGGLLLGAGLGWVGVVIGVVGLLASRVRGRHRTLDRQHLLAAAAWLLAVVTVGGAYWIAQGPHPVGPALTTLVALAAVAPLGHVGVRLLRAARR